VTRLREEVAARGFAVTPLVPELAARATSDPWGFVEALFGEVPDLIERQPIRAVGGGRSFAASSGPAPLHTDSQMHLGVPAHTQVLVCVRQATRGGASLLADGWSILERVRACDLALFTAALEEPRRLRFYFGDVEGPTWSLRGGSLVLTHPPTAEDAIGRRLQPFVAREPLTAVKLAPGEALVVDNHRMLHGREAFEGDRQLARVLAWLSSPLGVHPDAALRAALTDRAPARSARARVRAAAVLAMMRGVPPGAIAARTGAPERLLYAWRDLALGALDHEDA
jgi:hypothetical protein